MKYVITESKLNSAIYEYIDNLFRDGKEIKRVKYGKDDEVDEAYDFYYAGEDDLFHWTGRKYYDKPENSLNAGKWLELAPVVEIVDYGKLDVLNAMFDNLWRPVFIQWFEDTFSLPVKTLS